VCVCVHAAPRHGAFRILPRKAAGNEALSAISCCFPSSTISELWRTRGSCCRAFRRHTHQRMIPWNTSQEIANIGWAGSGNQVPFWRPEHISVRITASTYIRWNHPIKSSLYSNTRLHVSSCLGAQVCVPSFLGENTFLLGISTTLPSSDVASIESCLVT
jgi:hypothetical protein